jgi:carboxymethylenebutenolidase
MGHKKDGTKEGETMAVAIQEIVSPEDPEIVAGMVEFSGEAGKIRGYLSKPKTEGKCPGLIVIHENKGLSRHIQDVVRRYSKEGFAALAPDCLSRAGGTDQFATEEKTIEAIRAQPSEAVISDLLSGVRFLHDSPSCTGRVGVVGFCWGGGNSLLLATASTDIKACALYYGRSPSPLDLVEKISCPVLGNYGETDAGITSQVPALEEAMKKYGKRLDAKVFKGAGHAFNNNTNPDRYHPESAGEAWSRTVAFFRKHLTAGA